MVSGLVTSPCDHERILSGDARLMRIASKSDVKEPRLSKEGLIFCFSQSVLSALLDARGAPPPLARARRLRASRGPQALPKQRLGIITDSPARPTTLLSALASLPPPAPAPVSSSSSSAR